MDYNKEYMDYNREYMDNKRKCWWNLEPLDWICFCFVVPIMMDDTMGYLTNRQVQ